MVTRSGGLSKGSRGYNGRMLYYRCVWCNEANLSFEFSSQIRRARDALGLWAQHGAGKAVCVVRSTTRLTPTTLKEGNLKNSFRQ